MNKLIASLLVSQTAAADWNYIQHGADWGEGCTDGQTNQTPIDLLTPDHPEFERYPKIMDHRDHQNYFNQKGREVVWNGHTSQVNLNESPVDGEHHGFTSDLPQKLFGAGEPIDFKAKQFHFHSPSEHTYNGQYFDLEMHTVHLEDQKSPNGFLAAALGIMFSVDNYTAELDDREIQTIDRFFDTMHWQDDKPHVAEYIPYADLVNMVDFHNRWVYQGSVTTPPCAQKVFWNQISTVYPIKQHHVDQFKRQLAREVGVYAPSNLGEIGNYREIQKEDLHNVHYVSNPHDHRRRESRRGGDHDGDQRGAAFKRLERLSEFLDDGPNFTLEVEDDALVIRVTGAIKTAVSSALAAAFVALNI